MNYFEALELPPRLTVDSRNLQDRFHALSRKWHPDRFVRAGAVEQQRALDTSALLNDAYRTLRQPVSRAEYFLGLQGLTAADGDGQKPPPELLEEVFELNMALEELKSGDTDSVAQLRESDAKFGEMLAGTDRDIAAEFEHWDKSEDRAALVTLRALLDRRKYISNLLGETAKALAQHVSD